MRKQCLRIIKSLQNYVVRKAIFHKWEKCPKVSLQLLTDIIMNPLFEPQISHFNSTLRVKCLMAFEPTTIYFLLSTQSNQVFSSITHSFRYTLLLAIHFGYKRYSWYSFITPLNYTVYTSYWCTVFLELLVWFARTNHANLGSFCCTYMLHIVCLHNLFKT